MNKKRRTFMSQGKLSLFVLLGILINLLIFSASFAEAATDTPIRFLGNKNIAPVVYLVIILVLLLLCLIAAVWTTTMKRGTGEKKNH